MTIARENDSSIPGDILGDEMPLNDAYRWIASFCRDATYPMMLSYATYQFIKIEVNKSKKVHPDAERFVFD